MSVVRIQHMRQLGYCSRGLRQFWRKHGLDWALFLKQGIEGEQLRATGDTMAIKAVELAEQEQHG